MERVFVDANILYSRTIRDWLFALSTSKIQMFDLFSSEDVFAEVVITIGEAIRNVPAMR